MLDRLGVPLTLVGIRIRELKRFHEEGERNFKSRYAALEAEFDHLTPEEQSDDLQDHYIDLRDELESIRSLNTNCAIAGLFMAFESFLSNMLKQLKHRGVPGIPEQVPGPYWSLKDMKAIFAKVGVHITKAASDWTAIKRLQAVRHCITHSAGWPDNKTVRKLKGAQFSVSIYERLRLPPGYFDESIEIVQRSCKRIVDDCKRL